MTRILALDVEVLLASMPAGPVDAVHRLQWLIDALGPHADVRVVLLALRDRTGVELGQLALGELGKRVTGCEAAFGEVSRPMNRGCSPAFEIVRVGLLILRGMAAARAGRKLPLCSTW